MNFSTVSASAFVTMKKTAPIDREIYEPAKFYKEDPHRWKK